MEEFRLGLIELFILAIGLSMDAFAVSICKGLSIGRTSVKDGAIVGLYFGGFQALMPLIGYFLGSHFANLIEAYDHWIAFILLGFIGVRMFIGSFRSDDNELDDAAPSGELRAKKMLPLAVATSIDALAVGVTFAFLRVDIVPAVIFIGVTTFLFSMAGTKIGSIFGMKFKSAAERFGGAVLVLIGLKILLEHMGVIAF